MAGGRGARRWTRRLLAAAGAAAATGLTLHRACDLVFRCGCTWVWSAAAEHCNIHNPVPPHCPVCTDLGLAALFTAALFGLWCALLLAAGRAAARALSLRPAA